MMLERIQKIRAGIERVEKAQKAPAKNKALPKNVKINFDRLKNRYSYKKERLSSITTKIIEENQKRITNKVARMTKEQMDISFRKLGKKEKRMTFPKIEDVFPGRTILARKAAEKGKLISDTFRNELGADIRQAMKKHPMTYKRGRTAGRVNRDLIDLVEIKISDRFDSYTQKDPRYKRPSNIRQIAVTEVRSAVSDIKEKYIEKLIDTNNLIAKKRWIHNKSLSKVPRRGHMELDQVTIDKDDKFKVKVFKKNTVVRTDYMSRPHDPLAHADQNISCNCDVDYIVKRERLEKPQPPSKRIVTKSIDRETVEKIKRLKKVYGKN